VDAAFETLAHFTKRRPADLRRELVTYSHHDWTHDPFSRGAYSYVAVDGMASARRLGRPFLDGKLWLAGEATESGSARGTVHGAIRSGKRVAARILRDTLPIREAA
jgi:monoamine oxidase